MMTTPKTWFATYNHDGEYLRHYAPHIADDLWIESRGFSLLIHYCGTDIKIDGKPYLLLKEQAQHAIDAAGIIDYTNELVNYTIAEHVIASLIEKANRDEQ
jgi:hypothetical protein